MLARDHEDMDWGLGIQVSERERYLVLGDNGRRDLPSGNFTEYAGR